MSLLTKLVKSIRKDVEELADAFEDWQDERHYAQRDAEKESAKEEARQDALAKKRSIKSEYSRESLRRMLVEAKIQEARAKARGEGVVASEYGAEAQVLQTEIDNFDSRN